MSDSRELAARDEGGAVAAAEGRNAVSIPMDQRMAMLREALTNPDVDPAKATAMADLLWKIEDREREAAFNRAKIAAIREMPAIYKRGQNTHTSTRYAKFEDLHRAVMPVLASHGLTLDFRIGSEGRDITVQPILRHENGYIEEGGVMRGPADEGKGRSAIQAVGSASSYLKRYAMKAMLNIVEDGEDTDGVMPREGERINDRQAALIADAQEQFDAGRYAEWYGRLTARDKALLVSLNVHARLGGGQALPGPELRREAEIASYAREEPRRAEPERKEPASDNNTTGAGAKPQITPEQWVDRYCADIDKIVNVDRLDEYLDGKREALGRLEKSHPTLWAKANDHGRERRAAIEEGRLM